MKRVIILFVIVLCATVNVAQAQLIRHSRTLITKTKVEKPKKVKKELDPIQTGFQQTLSMVGVSDIDNHWGVGLSYIGGYRFNNTFFVGAGLQGEYFIDTQSAWTTEWGGWYDEVTGDWRDTEQYNITKGMHGTSDFCITAFAHARAYLSTRRFQPYVGASLGYSFCDAGAFVLSPEVGFDQRLTNKTSFSLGAGLWKHGEYNYLKVNIGFTF